jgi:hypothetical protein
VRGKLSSFMIDHEQLPYFKDKLGQRTDQQLGEDALMAQMLMYGLAPEIGGIGGAAIAASTAKAAVDAAGGNAAYPGGFAEAMGALGVSNACADRSSAWLDYVKAHEIAKFQWRTSSTSKIETATMTEMRVELERGSITATDACHAIRAAVDTLSAISAGRYQLQLVATKFEIEKVKGTTISSGHGTFTGASHRFEEETQLVPTSFWNQGSRSLTTTGALAVQEYTKIAAFAKDPDRSFRIMNDKGQLSKCLSKNEATAWMCGQVGKVKGTTRMAQLENCRLGLRRDGTKAPEGTPRRPFVVAGSYALFAK